VESRDFPLSVEYTQTRRGSDACWRWLRNRPDSPWYPTARVFGQPTPGDWDSVIDAVRSELAKVAR
jgi:hypothetical protein